MGGTRWEPRASQAISGTKAKVGLAFLKDTILRIVFRQSLPLSGFYHKMQAECKPFTGNNHTNH